MDIQQAVAENIHRIRKAQKLSIDRAAELSGVSKSMWGQIERGLANPTVSVLSRVALGLHVPLEQLIACHDDPPTALYRAVDVAGQRLCGGKVIAYRLFPFDPESRSESLQLDLFISGRYEGPDRVPGSPAPGCMSHPCPERRRSPPAARPIAWRTGTACPSPAVSPIAMKTSATTRSGLSSGSCIKNETSRQTTG